MKAAIAKEVRISESDRTFRNQHTSHILLKVCIFCESLQVQERKDQKKVSGELRATS